MNKPNYGWILLFICLSIKGIHILLDTDVYFMPGSLPTAKNRNFHNSAK